MTFYPTSKIFLSRNIQDIKISINVYLNIVIEKTKNVFYRENYLIIEN